MTSSFNRLNAQQILRRSGLRVAVVPHVNSNAIYHPNTASTPPAIFCVPRALCLFSAAHSYDRPPAALVFPGGGSKETSSAFADDTEEEELLNVRDVVELLRDFLRAKALTESEISREVGVFCRRRGPCVRFSLRVICVAKKPKSVSS